MRGSFAESRLARALTRYLTAIALALAAVVIRLALVPLVGPTSPYLTVYPAVMFASFYLGIGPGLAASLLGVLLTERYIIGPVEGLFIAVPEWVRASIVFFSAVFLGYAGHRVRSALGRISMILESIPDAFISIDAEGRCAYVNREAEQLLGLTRREVLGKPIWRHLPEVRDGEMRGGLEEALRSRRPCRLEVFFTRMAAWYEVHIHASPGGLSVYLRDVNQRRTAAEALHQSEERFAKAFRASPDGLVISSAAEGLMREVNESFLQLFGLRREEVVGRRSTDLSLFVEPDDRSRFLEVLQQHGRVRDFELTVRASSGELRSVLLAIESIELKGEPSILTIVRDVTERKRAEESLQESEERFRTLADNMSQFAWMADERGSLFWYNRRWFEYTGTTLEEMRGWGWQAVHHPDHVQRVVEKVRRCFEKGEIWEDTFPLRGQDGTYRWFLSRALPIRDEAGRVVRWFGTNTDITELRAAHEALEEDDRRKDEFLAVLGHELRNPLAAIITGVQLLRTRTAEEAEWVVDSIERQTRQLVRLVDDLLDVSRITRGRIQLKSEIVSLQTVVERAVESTVDLMTERRHAFTVTAPDEPLQVFGDPARLQQVVANLLSNAAKYTDDEGRIDLVLAREEDAAVVRVKDNGLGIPAETRETIFELFGQVDSAIHRPQQGLGIGLHLVKKLIELHQGTVGVESGGLGKGSEFRVHLPLLSATGASPDEQRPAAADLPPLDILLVEDNREAARMLCEMLIERRHRVRHALDGPAALELAAAQQPDLAILDIGLPGMSGYEVAERLRQELRCRDTLIVAATGYGQERDRQRSRAAGIDYHLVKPVDYQTLALLMREWLRTHHRRPSKPHFLPSETAAAPRPPARVLVIDDNPAIARMTHRILEQYGHEAEVAFDGESGLETARRFRPELVLCDLSMPGLDGYEVLSALKAEHELRDTLVVAVTGYAEAEEKQRTHQAGFHAHLVKPVSVESLLELINRLPPRAPRLTQSTRVD